MKTIQFHSPGGLSSLRLSEREMENTLASNELRVRIEANSLNGHDLNVVLGKLPVEEGRILLSDGAGVVEAIGSNVTEFSIGDKVVSTFFPDWHQGVAPNANFSRTPGDGLDGYGVESVIRPETWFTRIPKKWSTTEASTIPTAGLTAWRALVAEGQLKAGQTVLVLGTGGVSAFAIQFAKCIGANVIVTSSSDEKLRKAREIGADLGVNYRTHENWSAKVLELTKGEGVDLVVETGGAGTLPQSIASTRIGGRIVLVGVIAGISGSVPTVAIMGRQLTVSGITVGNRSHQNQLVRSIDEWNIHPVIDRTFTFDNIKGAFEYLSDGQHFGKICIIHRSK